MNLYEIPFQIRQALESVEVDEDSGEILGAEVLETLGEEAQKKILSTLAFVRELDSDRKALAEQISNLQKRKRACEKKIEFLKNMCLAGMQAMSLKRLRDSQITGSIRTTEKTEIDDLDKLPAAFVRTIREPNKTALKEALQAGEAIEGARLVKSESLSIR